MKLEQLLSFISTHKKYLRITFFIIPIIVIAAFAGTTIYNIAQASFGSWGDSSLIHACLGPRGQVTVISSGSCQSNETQDTWLKDVDAGTGLSIARSSSGATLSLADNAITADKIASGAVTFNKLNSNATNKFYTLTLGSAATTTTNTTASFGSISLPVESNVCIMSSLELQNNTSATGLNAALIVDSTDVEARAGTVSFSALGISYSIAKNKCISSMSAGSHTFGIKIDQFPFRSGDELVIQAGSAMWITATPTGN